jgi:hypothetical protein
MKFSKRDLFFVAVIAAVLGTLLMSTGITKAKNVPYDDRHIKFLDDMHSGVDRAKVEKDCAACHGIRSIPLSKAHPPKEQCLLCHKLVKPTSE